MALTGITVAVIINNGFDPYHALAIALVAAAARLDFYLFQYMKAYEQYRDGYNFLLKHPGLAQTFAHLDSPGGRMAIDELFADDNFKTKEKDDERSGRHQED
jgi:hypothetical protein